MCFGTRFHARLDAWWAGERSSAVSPDPYEEAEVSALMCGYGAMWGDKKDTWGVESELRFRVRLPGTSFDLVGSVDKCVRNGTGSYIVEHKTTSRDASSGSTYWESRLSLDPQVTAYLWAVGETGRRADYCLYDVVGRTTLTPALATPVPKYTLPTKTNPAPRLYAGHRLTAETPMEYETRVCADIEAHPKKYYHRVELCRTLEDTESWLTSVRYVASQVSEQPLDDGPKAWPMYASACQRFGGSCDYIGVCSGWQSITDDGIFETKQEQKWE